MTDKPKFESEREEREYNFMVKVLDLMMNIERRSRVNKKELAQINDHLLDISMTLDDIQERIEEGRIKG